MAEIFKENIQNFKHRPSESVTREVTMNVFFSKISVNYIHQAKQICYVWLYQKMTEIYHIKIKPRKSVYQKEIRRV